jgi:hypothetical protein
LRLLSFLIIFFIFLAPVLGSITHRECMTYWVQGECYCLGERLECSFAGEGRMFQQELHSARYLKDEEWAVSEEQHHGLPVRGFGSSDVGRAATLVFLMVALMAGSFFLLAWIQGLILPVLPGGAQGPWLIRPILALHLAASAVVTCVLGPVLMINLRRQWKAQDVAAGSRYDPYAHRPLRKLSLMAVGLVIAVMYGMGGLFYLMSWQVVGPEGIEMRSPWGRKNYAFNEIRWLDTIPAGMHSNSLGRGGPWYQVQFMDGNKMSFGSDNEKSSTAELATIASYIATQSKRRWQVYDDARGR